MNNTTDTIKDKLSIVDVVGSYVTLAPRGNAFVARCPFHNEKTPSFYVSPDRGTYHCFGCGKGGDIFSFVQEFEGVDFRESLQILANRAGVQIQNYSREQAAESKDHREKLFKAINETVEVYKNDLADKEAIKYLIDRGLEKQTIKTFDIGYAKNEWRNLTTLLKQNGFTDQDLIAAGLSVATEKGLYDKFRGRIMFPIANMSGRYVGFSGRVLPQYAVNPSGNESPKYMNSPETDLYHKSTVLYGYNVAREYIRKSGKVIVVEGMMDVLMAHQAGTADVVAVSGTALTAEHAKLLSRLADKVYVCFDSDQAGINALFKTVPMLISADLDVYVISLPPGIKDPADLVVQSNTDWLDAVNNANPLIEFLVQYAKKTHTNLKDLRNFCDTHIVPIVANIPKVMNRAHAINILSRAIDLPEETLYAAILEKEKHLGPKPQATPTNYKHNPSTADIFIGLAKLKIPENDKIIEKVFAEFLGEDPWAIVDSVETDKHTFESFAEQGLDEAPNKQEYVHELSLGFIKHYIEDKLKLLKENEGELEKIVEYTKKIDLINRHHHKQHE